jgi:hypothetical protein
MKFWFTTTLPGVPVIYFFFIRLHPFKNKEDYIIYFNDIGLYTNATVPNILQ